MRDDGFANVDHDLRQLPPGRQSNLTVTYPFSPAATDAVAGFASGVLA